MAEKQNALRDRVVELRRVRASDLLVNPRNWRLHPAAQRSVMQDVLSEIGYADALIARQLADGLLELLDGHLRKETTPDAEVPVLIVDLNDEEAAKFLTVHDPIAAMAHADHESLASLLNEVTTESEAIGELLAGLESENNPKSQERLNTAVDGEAEIPELFQLVIECVNEDEQRELYEEFYSRGYKCRLLVL